MLVISRSSSTLEWIPPPPSTNNYNARLAGRKRDRDEAGEEENKYILMRTSHPSKKSKTEDAFRDVSNASNACIDPRAPHEFLGGAGDWKFEPLVENTSLPDEGNQHSDLVDGDSSLTSEPVDVDKVIAILLEAMKPSRERMGSPEPPASSYQRHPTSPLSESLHRTPFIRKYVGGPSHGRVDPGLRKWVVCKNHVEDIRSFHPSLRSSEWVEALHEMGWEHLHPAYTFESQQTTWPLDVFPNSFEEWIVMDEPTHHNR